MHCGGIEVVTTQVNLVLDGPIARITLQGEKGIQILSAATRQRLLEIVEQVSQTDCSVAVFAAEGRTFIAGANIDELRSLSEESAYADSRVGQHLMSQIESMPQTTVAAIHSACAGGGTELALACDLRFAADGAKIGLPETTIGILPGWGGTVRATQLLGGANARRLILTGELISSSEALRIGLINGVFLAEHFAQQIEKVIEQVLRCAPLARRRVKHLLREHIAQRADLASQYEAEARAFAECYPTGEPFEGQTAFLEKRAANWTAIS